VEQPFIHAGLLKSYFAENLWHDLEKRGSTAALDLLRLLGCSAAQEIGLPERPYRLVCNAITPKMSGPAQS